MFKMVNRGVGQTSFNLTLVVWQTSHRLTLVWQWKAHIIWYIVFCFQPFKVGWLVVGSSTIQQRVCSVVYFRPWMFLSAVALVFRRIAVVLHVVLWLLQRLLLLLLLVGSVVVGVVSGAPTPWRLTASSAAGFVLVRRKHVVPNVLEETSSSSSAASLTVLGKVALVVIAVVHLGGKLLLLRSCDVWVVRVVLAAAAVSVKSVNSVIAIFCALLLLF